ncbi:glycosyltransferase family 4 protein [Deinococcus oregonensis]|uniref:Glycosyltransferase family 4 protein n=1 Tax=Deinococcus oregonensis TaxID=1805970 RepID=A0ABV6B5K2_9DEIO
MKLAFVTNFIQHYRVQTFELLSERVQTDFFLFSKGKEKYWLNEHGVRYIGVQSKHLSGFTFLGITFSPSLIWHLAKGDYDVYLSGIVGKFSLPITFLVAKTKRKPFVLWTGVWHRIDTKIHRAIFPLTKYIYQHADGIVVYGNHVRDYLISEGVEPHRIFIADHAVQNEHYNLPVTDAEKEVLRKKWGIRPEQKIILYLGRLVKEKGVKDLILALSNLSGDSILLIAGTGQEREMLELQAKALGVESQVRFVGYIQPEMAYQYFALADVSVLPSLTTPEHKEPWGLTVNESFNQGTPVIASDSVGAAAGGFLRDGLDGFIFPEGDWRALTDALKRVLEDQTLREQLSDNVRARVQLWDNHRMIDGFMRAFHFVTNKASDG